MPPTPRTPSDVFEAMHRLMHAYRARMVQATAGVHPGLTLNEVRALTFVGRHPGASQKELVAHSGVDKAQVARMVALLEEKGWVERVPHAQDKRSRCLTLSAAGLAVYASVRAARQSLSATLLHGVPPERQAQLLELLAHLHGRVDAMPEPPEMPPMPGTPCQAGAEF